MQAHTHSLAKHVISPLQELIFDIEELNIPSFTDYLLQNLNNLNQVEEAQLFCRNLLAGLTYTEEITDITNPQHLLCRRLAEFVDPTQINNLLMPFIHATDTYGNQFKDLLPGQFIISDDGYSFIELSAFFNAAFVRIKHGEKIWAQYIDAENNIRNLSDHEKQKMIAIHPYIENFFYLAEKTLAASKDSILELLENLRAALLQGDVNHRGSELNAGAVANVGLVNFKEKYDLLPLEERIEFEKLKTNDGKTLKNILTTLFKSNSESIYFNPNDVCYCIAIIGKEIENIIHLNINRFRISSYNLQMQNLIQCTDTIRNLIEHPHLRLFDLNCLMACKLLCKENPDLFSNKIDQNKTIIDLMISTNNWFGIPLNLIKKLKPNYIFYFIKTDDISAVQLMLADPEVFEKYVKEALFYAIKLNRINLVKYLTNLQLNINDVLEEWDPLTFTKRLITPLSTAIACNAKEIIQILLHQNAIIQPQDIINATQKQNYEILSLLIDVNPECITYIDEKGNTPLDYAIKADNIELLEFLLQKKATFSAYHLFNALDNGNFKSFFFLLQHNLNHINFVDEKGNNLVSKLITSSRNWTTPHNEILAFLIQQGADINLGSEDALTAAITTNNLIAIEILLKAHPNILLKHVLIATHCPNKIILSKLLSANPSLLEEKNNEGLTPLVYAIKNYAHESVATLLNHGAKMTNLVNGELPINYARQYSTDQLFILLLKSGSPAPFIPYAEIVSVNYEVRLMLNYVTEMKENNLPDLFAANFNSSFEVINLVSEILKLKTVLENEIRYTHNKLIKQDLCNILINLHNCTTVHTFNTLVDKTRAIIQKQPKLSQFISLNWMKKRANHAQFTDFYGKTSRQFLHENICLLR